MVVGKFLLKRLRKYIFKDMSIRVVFALSMAFGLIINVASVLIGPLWLG